MKERCFLFVWRVCRGTLRGGERKWLSEAPAEGLTGRWRKGVICPLVFKEKERKEEEERQWQQVAFRSGNGAARQIRSAVLSLLPVQQDKAGVSFHRQGPSSFTFNPTVEQENLAVNTLERAYQRQLRPRWRSW